MKVKFMISAAIVSALFYSCSPRMSAGGTSSRETQTAQPQSVLEDERTLSAEESLVKGKNLFENNCGRCHKLYSPGDFTREEWKPIATRMAHKAKLDATESDAVYAYLAENAK